MDYEPLNQERLQRTAAMFHVKLDETALERFALYARLLQSWNEKINLTAITATDDILIKHFADSLTVLPLLDLPMGASLIDVGTGAGFPGLALLIARPDLRVVLLDSQRKRLDFLAEVQARTGAAMRDAGGRPVRAITLADGGEFTLGQVRLLLVLAAAPEPAEFSRPERHEHHERHERREAPAVPADDPDDLFRAQPVLRHMDAHGRHVGAPGDDLFDTEDD